MKKKVPKKSILENILHCITTRHMNRVLIFKVLVFLFHWKVRHVKVKK
jgi:hypothetical protein